MTCAYNTKAIYSCAARHAQSHFHPTLIAGSHIAGRGARARAARRLQLADGWLRIVGGENHSVGGGGARGPPPAANATRLAADGWHASCEPRATSAMLLSCSQTCAKLCRTSRDILKTRSRQVPHFLAAHSVRRRRCDATAHPRGHEPAPSDHQPSRPIAGPADEETPAGFACAEPGVDPHRRYPIAALR